MSVLSRIDDCPADASDARKTVIGFRLEDGELKTDYMIFVYALRQGATPDDMFVAPGKTHEVSLYRLSHASIDFQHSIWTQKELRPLVPALASFQITAANDADALSRLKAVLRENLPDLNI